MIIGKSIVELTDVRTNKKEIYTDENIITKAVPDILSLNPSGLMYPLSKITSKFEEVIFPIAEKCYGGILLFEEPIEEKLENIYPPINNKCIAYASNDVNDTDNNLKGSLNLVESGSIENGHKFVWDFSTSQANGKISSLALTHYLGGRSYYGDMNNKDHMLVLNETYNRVEDDNLLRYYSGLVEANIEENYFIAITKAEGTNIEIIKVKEAYTSAGLNDSIIGMSPQKVEKITIDGSDFFSPFRYHYCNFFDGGNGYWYGFNHDGNSYGNARISRIKIKKDDFSTITDLWQLDNVQLNRLGKIEAVTSRYYSKSTFSVVKDQYLYIPSYDKNSIYKINIDNPVDVTKIDLGFITGTGSYSSGYDMYKWGNQIVARDFNILSTGEIVQTKSLSTGDINNIVVPFGPFYIGYSGISDGGGRIIRKSLLLHTPYLGTINNLSTPILKTADKTMKITYTLTEVEGNL